MAKRQRQFAGSSQSKGSQSSGLAVTSPPDCDEARRLRDYNEILRGIHERVMVEGVESVDHYGNDKCRVLEGDELIEGLRRYDGVSLIQERVIELQGLQRMCHQDVEELVWLEIILELNGFSLLRCLRNTVFAMGLDPRPFTVVLENLTTETRAQALALAELMALHQIGTSKERVPSEQAREVTQQGFSLTKSQVLVLRTMNIFDSVLLLSNDQIRREACCEMRIGRETVRRAIEVLQRANLADRPEGPRRGCRLTIAGRRLASQLAE